MMWFDALGAVMPEHVARDAIALLADAAIKAAVLLMMVGVAMRWLRGSSAAARHLLWSSAIASLVVIPIVSLTLPGWRFVPDWPKSAPSFGTIPISQLSTDVHSHPIELPAADAIDRTPLASAPPQIHDSKGLQIESQNMSWQQWAFVVWVLGGVIAFLPWPLGVIRLWLLERSTSPRAAMRCPAFVSSVACSAKLRRRIRFVLDDQREMPMQWGILWPRIVLPASVSAWSPDQVRAMLLHELAHVRRWDCLTQLVARCVCALYWFHPFVWRSARRMRWEAEAACDDMALRSGCSAADYAEQLVLIAARKHGVSLANAAGIGMAQRFNLEDRVARILASHANRQGLSISSAGATMALLAIMIAPIISFRVHAIASDHRPKVPADDVVAAVRSSSPERSVNRTFDPLKATSQVDRQTLAMVSGDDAIVERSDWPIRLSQVSSTAGGMRSLGGSGHAVEFQRPESARHLMAVEILASRYGNPEPPAEDFHLYVLDRNQQVIQAVPFPYEMINRGPLRWYTLSLPALEVPERFFIALSFNPHRTKGIYLGFDNSIAETNSYVGRPTTGFQPVSEKYEWMIRPVLVRNIPSRNPFAPVE